MGTNYYRIPSAEEMEIRKETLIKYVQNLPTDCGSILTNWRTTIKMDDRSEGMNRWERFTDDVKIHLGKRSGGWKFLWNFHENVYYSDKEELLAFIRSGRVIDEYGTEINVEEFIKMSLEWGQPNGYDMFSYVKENPKKYFKYNFEREEKYIDGLRVSGSTEFS
jgi:hypothetical protein